MALDPIGDAVSITLTKKPPTPVAPAPLLGNASYLLDTLLTSGDVDLTCAVGGTPSTAGSVAGPFTGTGQYAKGLYCEVGGTVDYITSTGVRDKQNVPANGVISLAIAYVVKATTTATGIHAMA
jgi:hypothetical protein